MSCKQSKKRWSAIQLSDKLPITSIISNEERRHMIEASPIYEEIITMLSLCLTTELQYEDETELEVIKLQKSTIIFGDFITLLSVIDRIDR